MGPELKVLLLAGVTMAFAYILVYPRLRKKPLMQMMLVDLALSAALVLGVGLAYSGTGTRFFIVHFTLPWWAFTLIAASIVEIPLFIWFWNRWKVESGFPQK